MLIQGKQINNFLKKEVRREKKKTSKQMAYHQAKRIKSFVLQHEGKKKKHLCEYLKKKKRWGQLR